MSDIQLKSEIENIIKKSGHSQSEKLLCPIVKIVSMRHRDIPMQQILKITKSIL